MELAVRLRVIGVLVVGLPACAALLVAFPWLGLAALRGGPPLETSDWVAGVLVAVLSLVAFVIALRAGARAWTGGASRMPVMAKLAPVLVLAGAAVGAWVGDSIQGNRVRGGEDAARGWCERPALVQRADVASCEAAAIDCLHLAWEGAVADASLVAQLDDSLRALRQRTEREATQAAKGAGFYDGGEVRVLDRLREQLRADSRRAEDTRVRQAGLLCLFSTGTAP